MAPKQNPRNSSVTGMEGVWEVEYGFRAVGREGGGKI